jgi:[acyl-carrier-protein] S-malonyltransferase
VAAGALEFVDALELVHRRGELMYQAGLERPGAMAAILGLEREVVESVCEEASATGVVRAANLNGPGQVVISGEIPAVERACEGARERGAKRAVRLEVSGAFHSPLMASAARGLGEALDRVSIRPARCPVVVNVSATPLTEPEPLRASLKAQLLSAVRWEDSMRLLLDGGATGFLELGTGTVLRGLLRTLDRKLPSFSIGDPTTLDEALGAWSAANSVSGAPVAGKES